MALQERLNYRPSMTGFGQLPSPMLVNNLFRMKRCNTRLRESSSAE